MRSAVPKIKEQRKAAVKANVDMKDVLKWYANPMNRIPEFMAAMIKPEDKPYISARTAHQATIVHYTKKDGTRGGCIGKGSGAAYEHDFNGKTQAVEYTSVPEIDVGLFRDDEEEPVPLKWRRLRPKYQLL